MTDAPKNPQGQSKKVHPLYADRLEDWRLMEDCYAGERTVKEAGERYLPATAGQRADGLSIDQPGYKDYQAYKKRALFHDVVKEAVQAMVGVMHRKPAVIELPRRLEAMLKRATPDGEGLQSLLRRINEQQLLNARIGLLVEVPTGKSVAEAVPFIATYNARFVLNWDAGISDQGERKIEMVALDESAYERVNAFDWKYVEKVRVLVSDRTQLVASAEPAAEGYAVALLRDGLDPKPDDFAVPSIGGKTMDRVPFVFVNANDLVPDTEAPPLLGLANVAMALYRADADYRQNLFMQGQSTLVISGGGDGDGKELRTGAGAVLDLPKGGEAKYIGVEAAGLDAQEKAISNLLTTAAERGTKLLEFGDGSGSASGDALRIRVAARTTTLTSVAITGAEGLKTCLRMAAEWVGANPDEVVVNPNLEFADSTLTGNELLAFKQAQALGLPLSNQSLHTLMRSRDLTELTFEEEIDQIEEEGATLPGVLPGAVDPAATEPSTIDEDGNAIDKNGQIIDPKDPQHPDNKRKEEAGAGRGARQNAGKTKVARGVPGGAKRAKNGDGKTPASDRGGSGNTGN